MYENLRADDDSSPRPLSAGEALSAYIGAFSRRDADFLSRIFSPGSLAEVPALRPNRLVGLREICAGHRSAFSNIAVATFTPTQSLAETDGAAIWVGSVEIRRVDEKCESHELGIVAEIGGGKLSRLSLHFDARNIRRWSDPAIL